MTHLPHLRKAAADASLNVANAMAVSMAAKRRYREAVLRESRNTYITKITWKEWKKREERRERMEELLIWNAVRRMRRILDKMGPICPGRK